MKKLSALIALSLIAGCGEDAPAKPAIKATYSEIQKEFSENGVAAKKKYSNQPVELTDTVNSIKEGGLVFLVSDDMTAYGVVVEESSLPALEKLKPGDKVTVTCSHVDSLSISDCSVSR